MGMKKLSSILPHKITKLSTIKTLENRDNP